MADTSSPLESQLLASLIADWGYVMGSAGLRKALGFATQQSLRHAIRSGHVPFTVFTIEGRKGPYARTHDVAAWLASHSPATSAPQPDVAADGAHAPAKLPRKSKAP